MGILTFKGVKLSGIAACVPRNITQATNGQGLMTESELQKTIKFTGVESRRSADHNICASDLCYKAALSLFEDLKIAEDTIDLVLFVSQTPDYRLPATACTLQRRLKLNQNVGAFDINLGCSGYVYGLSVAYAFASQSGMSRVLLLCGDTITKAVSPQDRSTALLFGDAGSATLVEKSDVNSKAYFSLNTDGEGEDVIKIKGGGYRQPSSHATLASKRNHDGGVRNDEQIYMDGARVFNFTIDKIPKDINRILTFANQSLSDVDYIVFHQANQFILNYLTKKLKYSTPQAPSTLAKYGNTSCATIPLTVVDKLKNQIRCPNKKNILFSGFGVGLSWATALIEISGCHVSDLVEI